MSSRATRLRFAGRRVKIDPRIIEKLKAWIKSAEAEDPGTPSHKLFPHAADLPSPESATYPGT